jgi:hypothetical protein
MMKKMLFVGGGLLLLAGLVFGRSLPSYVSTAWDKGHQAVRDATPVSFDLDRLRGMVKQLDPEIRHNVHAIALEEIQVERLQAQIASDEEKLAKDKADILTLKSDLESNSQFVYSGRTYTADQVRADLKNRFVRFETNEATLKSRKEILAARLAGLDSAREKQKEVEAQRLQLDAEIAALEARQKSVEVAQTASKINVDDSHLARTRDLLAEVRAKIEVNEKLVHREGKSSGEIVLDAPVDENITDRIAKKFGIETNNSANVATKPAE